MFAGAPSPYVNYGFRLLGWLIDFVILLAVGVAIEAIFNASKVARMNFHITNNTTHVVTFYHYSALAPIIQVVIVLLYGAVLCGSERGQTLGMMAVGARAVDANSGGPIGFWRGLGRAGFEYLLFVIFFVPWVVDMLFPAWDAGARPCTTR